MTITRQSQDNTIQDTDNGDGNCNDIDKKYINKRRDKARQSQKTKTITEENRKARQSHDNTITIQNTTATRQLQDRTTSRQDRDKAR